MRDSPLAPYYTSYVYLYSSLYCTLRFGGNTNSPLNKAKADWSNFLGLLRRVYQIPLVEQSWVGQ